MIIDNFAKIREHLKFDKPGDFYVVKILFRVKDLRDEGDREFYLSHEETQRLIKSYHVDSIEYFDKKKPAMIDLAKNNRARVYIIPSRKNKLVTSRVIAKKIIEFIDDPNIRYDHMIRSAVDGCHISDNKWWVIDVDNNTVVHQVKLERTEERGLLKTLDREVNLMEHKDELIEELRPLVDDTEKRSGSEIYELPTKNGCHILTPPFNRAKGPTFCLSDCLKNDGMTLAYYNGEV